MLVMFQLPFSVFLMRNSFEAIPRELEEAALVDGCSNVGALRHVSLRLVVPGSSRWHCSRSWRRGTDSRAPDLPHRQFAIHRAAYGGQYQHGLIRSD